ncbi:MAG: hypothetical protein PHO18_03010 [Synergistaceae bacterium]|nr:hypothetical protein [Synergistaceae bacterium]
MFLFSSLPVIPLPVLSLLLPMAAAFLPLIFYIYRRIRCWHSYENCTYEINLRFLKLLFLLVLIVNLFLTWSVWMSMGTGGTELFLLSSGGWSKTLSPGSPMLIKAVLQADVFGAMSAFLMGCIAFIAGLAAMADRNDPINLSKVSFFLTTLAGIQGIFYSAGIFSFFFFILISQIGASGLIYGIVTAKKDLKELTWYYISRAMALLMFLAGGVILYYNYKTVNIAVLSTMIKLGTNEKFAYALLVVPLLFMFIKSSSYIADSSKRVFFAIRAQASLFVVFRIIFSLYGPLQGLEKIPNLFILLGLILLVSSLVLTAKEEDPVKFAGAVELFMKGFLIVSMGISISGTYSAQAAAEYGLGAIESMVALWILFLPVSAALSFICCTLKQETNNGELWTHHGLFNEMPISGIAFLLAVSVIAGLPPFVGFPAKQFLYRSSNYITPLLTIFLMAAALAVLLISVRYISKIMFGKPSEGSENIRNKDVSVIVPLLILFGFLVYSTVMPSLFFDSMVSPSVYSLLNKGQMVNAINQGGTSE